MKRSTKSLSGIILTAALAFGTSAVYAQEGIDVVFNIDESGSMGDDIAAVKANVLTIFNNLPAGSHVGLVGFGSSQFDPSGNPLHVTYDYKPHVHTPLTSDYTVFEAGVGDMTAYGGIEPGYDAVYLSATDSLNESLGFRGVAYCNVLISDEPSNGNDYTKAQAIAAIQGVDGVFFGVVPAGSPHTSYQDLATATGGQIFDLTAFKADPTAVLTGVLDACKAAVNGRMTGGGKMADDFGGSVTHGFELHCTIKDTPNNLEVNWGGNSFHLDTLTKGICYDDDSISEGKPVAGMDTYSGSGTGTLNGVPGASVEFTFTDAGEPGAGNDTASIVIKDASDTTVLSVNDKLIKGNHQAHTSNE